jgi:hypothetical protein
MWRLARLSIPVLAVLCAACSDDRKSDLADSVTGPGLTVHCSAQTPRGAVGDTSFNFHCPGTPE